MACYRELTMQKNNNLDSHSAFSIHTKKSNIAQQTKVALPLPDLEKGEVCVRIESFGFSSNNVTYAVTGDTFGYWGFFPAWTPLGTVDINAGIIPLWGFAVVTESAHPEIGVGQRLFGYLPMASHWIMSPQHVSTAGFSDNHPTRVANSPVYNQYTWCANDPMYDASREAWQANFRPLFLTSFVLKEYIAAETVEQPTTILLTSASSKTAYGCAYLLKQLAQCEVVGLTSERSVDFVTDLGCYDEVIEYSEVANMRFNNPVWILDFAGNKALLQQLQEILDARHRHTSFIGITDVQAQTNKPDGKIKGSVFFAPDHVKMLNKTWGKPLFNKNYTEAWAFVANCLAGHLMVEEHKGVENVLVTYQSFLKGKVDTSQIVLCRW
jgi:hypothetical protein